MSDQNQAFFIDGITAVGIHNSTVRVQFMRIDVDGKPVISHSLLFPVSTTKSILDAFRKLPTT